MSDQVSTLYVRFFTFCFAAFSLGIGAQQILLCLLFLVGLGQALIGKHRFASAYQGIHSAGIFFAVMLAVVLAHQWMTGFEQRARFHWAFVVMWAISIPLVSCVNWRLVHRALVVVSLPGLIFSLFTLMEPAEFQWALKIESFSMYPRAYGFVSNPITNAEGLVVIAGWTLARLESMGLKERRWMRAHLVISVAIIVLSRVRAGVVGFVAILILHAMFNPRHRKAIGLGILITLAGFAITLPIFGFNSASINERMVLTQHSLELWFNHFWLGIGPDNYAKYPIPETGLTGHAHNTLLGVATEYGLFGLLAFLWFLFHMGKRILALFSTYRLYRGPLPWVTKALCYAFCSFIVFGLFDYNLGDTELLILHGYHWAIALRIPLKHEPLE